ncbi:TMEM165/GDT1 family protein [Polynucleobacter sp. AM-26B4]|jgi:putative Ca2+/H+ antiporter (TMEM165/GDT1 family)|uniref:TMEM165/GDT1 family protein n=1 Tax=Polynucleobacter sp. AM-26B4 TaxID=2689103 RepID=UPI001C0B7688|nr:TMEM165/GDT1 family protein [Polynucleobacter sp. AM-26B4]MBU3584970.1 TMEM165/GDT1 family protein [Polynucleobacter sp. AM-26B4]
MDLNYFFLATSIVALAEIGDKTQLLSLMLSARYKDHHWAIIGGIFIATLLNHALAALLGSTISAWISPEVMKWILGGGFIALGLWLLIPDKLDGDEEAPPTSSSWKVFTITTSLFFIAEMGDKTQVATVALGARYDDLLAVVMGTTVGMMLANAPAVWLGKKFTKALPIKWVHGIAAVIFIAIGVATLFVKF